MPHPRAPGQSDILPSVGRETTNEQPQHSRSLLLLAGLITMERRGKNMLCGINHEAVRALATYLGSRLEHLHPTDPPVIAAALIVVALLFAVRWLSRSMQAEDSASS